MQNTEVPLKRAKSLPGKPSYKDVLDYIISVGCSYYFEYIPLDKIGLQTP